MQNGALRYIRPTGMGATGSTGGQAASDLERWTGIGVGEAGVTFRAGTFIAAVVGASVGAGWAVMSSAGKASVVKTITGAVVGGLGATVLAGLSRAAERT